MRNIRSRLRLRAAGLAALAAMFFAQAAIALAACDPAKVQSRAGMVAAQQAEPAPCHEPVDNANLCLAHCQSEAQTLDKHQVKVPELSASPVLVVQVWKQPFPSLHRAPGAPLAAAGPPPRILFRSLLI